MSMKRGLRIAVMALILGVCRGVLPLPASAAEPNALVSIPIEIQMVGNVLPQTDTVTVKLEPVTPDAPMPAQRELTVVCRSGRVTRAAFDISYTALGIYRYKAVVTGSDYYLAAYDSGNGYPKSQTYLVTVSVVNKEAYTGFDTWVAIYPEADPEGDKCDAISHSIPYVDPLTLKVVKKWADQDSDRPGYVSIDLLLNGETVEGRTLILSRRNHWQGSWNDLDPRLKWTVQEINIPAGYTASYRYKNGIWYVTNTGSLLQTGQVTWPILALCAVGFGLMAAGAVLLRRRRDRER